MVLCVDSGEIIMLRFIWLGLFCVGVYREQAYCMITFLSADSFLVVQTRKISKD